MADLRVIKTYAFSPLSGAPKIVKFDGVTRYCYAKVYPTIGAAASASLDVFTANIAGYADGTLSGARVAAQIISNGRAYYCAAWESISAETEVYAGDIPAAYIQSGGVYLSGIPRIGEILIDGTPHYLEMFPVMVTAGIYDLTKSAASSDEDYIPTIDDPTYGAFPTITRSGGLENSVYSPASFDPTGTAVAEREEHEAAYNHAHIANGQTAYGWGDHAGLYSLTSHTHTGYATSTHTHSGVYAEYSHTHTGYAASNHTHTGTYALLSHNHVYSYANIIHTHSAFVNALGIGSTPDGAICLDIDMAMSASGHVARGIFNRPALTATANDDVLSAMTVYGSGAFGIYTGGTLSGIDIPNMPVTSGTAKYKQAITISAQSGGSSGNWGIVDYNNAYFGGNVSALSFTDRTPDYNEDALEAIRNIKGKHGMIDHETLPEFARAHIGGNIVAEEHDGRDIGAMVSVLTKGMQQLLERVEILEER
ncbi:MAG: hypothetical protein WC455_16490 [Dehalococcoidia bacterium]|jgi:hypothetical protein